MNIELYLDEIKERLQPLVDDGIAEVMLLSHVEDDFSSIQLNKPRVSVLLYEAKPEQTKSIDKIVQHLDLTFHVMINGDKLYGEDKGIFDIFKKVNLLLLGFDPTDCDNLQLGGFMYSRYLSKIWEYVAVYTTTTLLVQDFTPDTSVTITQLTVNSEYGSSQVETE